MKGWKYGMKKVCINCSESFVIPESGQNKIYCSNKCGEIYRGQGHPMYEDGLSAGKIGTIAELEVSSDLMKKGFEVYRALSSASSCDLLAIKNNKFWGFEVRTGYKRKNGEVCFPKNNIRAEYVAIFIHMSREIIYYPKL